MKTKTSVRKKLKLLIFLASLSIVIALFSLVMIFLLKMKDTVKARGIVRSVERLELVTPANGLIKEIYKREGDSVKRGELLLKIESEELNDKLLEISGELLEEKALLKLAKSKLILIKQNPLPEEFWHVVSRTKLIFAKKQKFANDLKRAKKLFQKKVISEKSFREVELESTRVSIEYEECCQLKRLIENGLAKNIVKSIKSEVNLVNIRIKILKNHYNSIHKKIQSCKIISPHNGIVVRIPEIEGLYSEQNTPLIQIVWGKKKFIRAKIHEKMIQDIKKNQFVICYSVHYDKYKTKAFNGKVLRILTEVKKNIKGSFYEVDITLLDEPKVLKLGSTVDIQIVTGKKTIFNALVNNK